MLFKNGSVLSRFSMITGFPNLRYSFVIFFFKDETPYFLHDQRCSFAGSSNLNLILSIRLPVSTSFRINLATLSVQEYFHIIIPPF